MWGKLQCVCMNQIFFIFFGFLFCFLLCVCACVHTLEGRGVGEVTMCVHESNFCFFLFFVFLCFFLFVFFVVILSIKIMPTYIYLRFESQ